MAASQYDVVVIGAGSGGLTSAVGFAKVGKSVLLIEQEHIGGECTNSGCIPSKALLHQAKTYFEATTIAGATPQTTSFRDGALPYVRNVVANILEEETPAAFEKLGIDVVMEKAVFVSPTSVRAGDTTYTFSHAIIATGSTPRHLDIAGMNDADLLTNQNLFDITEIPEKLLIVGGGPIGLEMGEAFALLGSQVTIADTGERFARHEDKAVSAVLQEKFESLGINLLFSSHIQHVKDNTATFTSGDTTTTVTFDKILLAIGRVPTLPEGLSEANIDSTKYGITIDSQNRTTNKRVYALGDVAERLKFTHVADDRARQVVTRVVSRGLLGVKQKKAVPKVTYTEPEVAQVGLSFDAAVKKYSETDVLKITVPFTTNDRAKTEGKTDGVLIVIVRRLSGRVVGANIISPAAGEILNVFTVAIDQKISMWKLRSTIFAYPTYSLIIKKAGDYFFATQMNNLKSDLLQLVKKHGPKVAIAVLWAVGLFLLYRYQQASGMTPVATALMIFDFISMSVWGMLLYIVAYAIRPITFFPGTALTILSGVFFGFWGGSILTIIAANISAIIAYGVGRFFGNGLSLEDSVIGNWVSALRKNPFESVLVMRLIFLPFDGVSYVAGILKIPALPFSIATFVGTLLGIATFVSIGASIDIESFRQNGFSTDVIDGTFILVSGAVFILSLGISKLLKRWRTK